MEALNRSAITGVSFSTVVEGYDREEVARHLAVIAERVEQARATGPEASDELHSILEGAQQSAAALRETALREAREITEQARREADVERARANDEATTQIRQANAAVRGLLERVNALQLGVEESQQRVQAAAAAMAERLAESSQPLVAVLGERAEALGAELDLIGSGLARRESELPAVTGPAPTVASPAALTTPAPAPLLQEPQSPSGAGEEAGAGLAAGDLEVAARDLATASGRKAPSAVGPAPSVDGPEASAVEPAPSAGEPEAARRTGSERARIVALNMALGGKPREETERHLQEEFDLDDTTGILDEAYSRADKVG